MSTIIKTLRERLQPLGNAPLVGLRMSPAAYYDLPFIEACIDEVERKAALAATGTYEMSNLDKLALYLLLDSAYMDVKDGIAEVLTDTE